MSSSRRNVSEKPSSRETVHRASVDIEAIPERRHKSSSSKNLSSTTPNASSSHSSKHSKRHRVTVESDPEEDVDMTSPSKSHSSSSKKHPSSSSSKSRSSKSDNWTDVTEPEERRRIQNRLAQRKFREKAKESREQAERDARNQELAGSSYTVPVAWDELPQGDDECSGLPWGSISMRHVVSRGGGGSGSGRRHGQDYNNMLNAGGDNDDSNNNDDVYAGGNYTTAGAYVAQQTMAIGSPSYQHSYGSHDNSSGAGADFFDDGAYYYNTDYDGSL